MGLALLIGARGQGSKFPLNLPRWEEEGRTHHELRQVQSPKSTDCASTQDTPTHKPQAKLGQVT